MNNQPEFVTFDRMENQQAAVALSKLLTENGVENFVEDQSANFDPAFSSNGVQKEFRVKMRREDFAQADQIVENAILGDLEQTPDDYYLKDFTDAELLDVIAHKDEWSPFDFMLARKLLRERGKDLSAQELDAIRNERLSELAKPAGRQWSAITFGYGFALLGGLLGIFIGWGLRSRKKTLPNGEIVYAYQEADRAQGLWIIYTGILSAIAWAVVKVVVLEN